MIISTTKTVIFNCILLICFSVISIACKNKDKKFTEEVNDDDIFFDYKISGEEGYDNLTILLKFKSGDKTGDAISANEIEEVKLDDEILIPDSSKMNGTFYELQKPIASFSGKHFIKVNTGKKEYIEEVNFTPLDLLTTISEQINREDLVLDFSGLEIEDYVRVLLTDTSFFNDGINRIDTVRNNQLIIRKTDLDNLADGPILMEFIREFQRPVENGTEAGGRVRINYTLRRTFNLQD